MQQAIKVTYVDHMGSDKRVTNAARVSFNKWEEECEPDERDIGLLHYLATGVASSERQDYQALYKASTHWTPFAHCQLTIRCAVPIFLARQLVKHQQGLCWSEESRRYIKEKVNYWLPEVIHAVPEGSIKQGAGKVHPDSDVLLTQMRTRTEDSIESYEQALNQNVAPEEARMLLPQNAVVNFIWTGSLAAFIRVYAQRSDSHAQGAAQEFAGKLHQILMDYFPEATKAYTDYL